MKKKQIVQSFLASLMALSVQGVQAADPGFYLGAGAGVGQSNAAGKGESTVSKVFVGYDFNKYLGVEAGIVDLGEFTGGFTSGFSASGAQLAVVGSFPATAHFSIFGKLGLYSWSREQVPCLATPCSSSGSSVTAGFGMQYMFIKNLGLRTEMEVFGQVWGADVAALTFSVVGHF